MSRTEEKIRVLIKWLERQTWWNELPYKKEIERLQRVEEEVHKFVQNPVLIEQLMMSLGYTPEDEADYRAVLNWISANANEGEIDWYADQCAIRAQEALGEI